MKSVFTLGFLFFPLAVFSQAYQLEYSRTYNKVKADNNTLFLTLKANGEMDLKFPSFTPVKKTVIKSTMQTSVEDLHQTIKALLTKKINPDINRKLSVIKSDASLPLFYSSEVDQFNLTISLEGKVVWQHEFYNWEELKHFYKHLGEWQPLVDVVAQIQVEVARISNANNQEHSHE